MKTPAKVPNVGKVKVKIKNTPAVHIHTSKQVVLKTAGEKPKTKDK